MSLCRSFCVLILMLCLHWSSGSPLPAMQRNVSELEWPKNAMNEYVERVIKRVVQMVAERGLDPIPLPDQSTVLEVKSPLGTLVLGEISLRGGQLWGLLSLFRAGEMQLEYVNRVVIVTGSLGLSRLQLLYNFQTALIGIGPSGRIFSVIENARLGLKFTLDATTFNATLNSLSSINVGDIDVSLFGLGSLEFLAEAVTNVAVDVGRDVVLNLLSPAVEQLVRDTFVKFAFSPQPLIPTLPPLLPPAPTLSPLLPPF